MFESLKETITDKIEEVGETIKEAIERRNTPFDTSKFNDPIADQTEWLPLKSGGTNFRTHTLSVQSGEARFKATIGAYAFGATFAAVGIGILFLFVFLVLKGEFEPQLLFMLIFPVAFGGVGIYTLKLYTTPVVFDKQLGYFYVGKVKHQHHFDEFRSKPFCKLKNIVALQIIAEQVSSSSSSGGSSSYRSYEINLVLRDASRLNVIDHGNYHKLMLDATELSHFLRVPLWEK